MKLRRKKKAGEKISAKKVEEKKLVLKKTTKRHAFCESQRKKKERCQVGMCGRRNRIGSLT